MSAERIRTTSRPLVLRNRNFLLLWGGQVFSQAGTRIYQIAMLWWILGRSAGSGGRETGLFLVIGALPGILLVKTIGHTVDRLRTKSLLVVCDLTALVVTLAVTALLWRDQLPLWGAFLAGFVLALLQAFLDPTMSKAVPELVEPEDIEAGVAFQTSTQSLANFGGAVAGAVLINVLGIPGVALVNAVSYLVSTVCSASLEIKESAPAPAAATTNGPGFEPVTTRMTWSGLAAYPVVRGVLAASAAVNFFATPTLVILPLYAKHALGGDASTLGMLEAAVWLGLIIGTFAAPLVTYDRSVARLGAAGIFVFGLGLFLPGLIIHTSFYVTMLLLAGTSLGICNVKFVAMFQEQIPAAVKGSFFALMQALISFTFPVAFFLFGVLGDLFTAPHVCLIQGGGTMALAAGFLLLIKTERRLAVNREGRQEPWLTS